MANSNYQRNQNAGGVPSSTPMAPRGNTLAPKKDDDKLGVYLGKANIKVWLNNVLGNQDEAAKFVANITSCVAANPALSQCDSSTVVSAGLIANSLKLSLSSSLGHCYLVPFDDKKNNRKVATFILGYKGYIQLAIRSGQYLKINVIAIKQGEILKYDRIHGEVVFNPIADDLVWENTPTVGYYAYFELLNGYKKELYWSKEKMQLHADRYSKAYSMEKDALLKSGQIPQSELWKYSSYWYTDFDGMAYKTMIRQLIGKHGVMSIEMQKAFEADDDYKKEEFFSDNTTGARPVQENANESNDEESSEDDKEFDFFAGISGEEGATEGTDG